MGLINNLVSMVFGNGRNVVAETAQVFRENAEAGAARDARASQQVMEQFSREFAAARKGRFDRVMDAINRIPRPALALGTLGLFIAAMADPVWFSQRMQGIALVPDPLWWLLGAIVSFYFGARHQFKGQQFQQSLATTMALTPQVVRNLDVLGKLESASPGMADTGADAELTLHSTHADDNAALNDWRHNGARER